MTNRYFRQSPLYSNVPLIDSKNRTRMCFSRLCAKFRSRAVLAGGVILVVFVCLGSGGCGMKGPLELPPEQEESSRAISLDY